MENVLTESWMRRFCVLFLLFGCVLLAVCCSFCREAPEHNPLCMLLRLRKQERLRGSRTPSPFPISKPAFQPVFGEDTESIVVILVLNDPRAMCLSRSFVPFRSEP